MEKQVKINPYAVVGADLIEGMNAIAKLNVQSSIEDFAKKFLSFCVQSTI